MNGLGYTLRHFAGDMFATILFLTIFLITHNIVLATGLGIGIGVIQLAWQLVRRAPVGMMQWASLGLVAVFGTATLLTHDPRFIMFKPTAINLIVGVVMLKPGWMERYVPEAVREVARPMLKVFGFIWAGLMFLTAALNLALVATVDPRTWAEFNLYFPPASMIGLFVIQNAWMRSRRAMATYRETAISRQPS
ncbi:MAG: septation protein IspZ [Caulobacteraceae bacterium]